MIAKTIILPFMLIFLFALVALIFLGVLIGMIFRVAVFVLIILGIVWLIKELKGPRRRR